MIRRIKATWAVMPMWAKVADALICAAILAGIIWAL